MKLTANFNLHETLPNLLDSLQPDVYPRNPEHYNPIKELGGRLLLGSPQKTVEIPPYGPFENNYGFEGYEPTLKHRLLHPRATLDYIGETLDKYVSQNLIKHPVTTGLKLETLALAPELGVIGYLRLKNAKKGFEEQALEKAKAAYQPKLIDKFKTLLANKHTPLAATVAASTLAGAGAGALASSYMNQPSA